MSKLTVIKIQYFPAFKGTHSSLNNDPPLQISMTNVRISERYLKEKSLDEKKLHDFALIMISAQDYQGMDRKQVIEVDFSESNYNPWLEVMIVGYPQVQQGHKYMCYSKGHCFKTLIYQNKMIEYQISTEHGYSGGPLLQKRSNHQYVVIGIHISGKQDNKDLSNQGLRLTTQIFQQIEFWRKEMLQNQTFLNNSNLSRLHQIRFNTTDYPFNAIVSIETKFYYKDKTLRQCFGTGFIINKEKGIILTAKCNVNQWDQRHYQSVEIYITFSDNSNTVRVQACGYSEQHETHAILFIDPQECRYSSSMSVNFQISPQFYKNHQIAMIGYRYSKDLRDKQLFIQKVGFQNVNDKTIQYDCQTSTGCAGAPILAELSSGEITVIGIHSSSKHFGGYKQGFRLNLTMKADIIEWVRRASAQCKRSIENYFE